MLLFVCWNIVISSADSLICNDKLTLSHAALTNLNSLETVPPSQQTKSTVLQKQEPLENAVHPTHYLVNIQTSHHLVTTAPVSTNQFLVASV